MSRLQPFNVLTFPPVMSAKNSVHVPFGFELLNAAKLPPSAV
jgi:hypothetical protein